MGISTAAALDGCVLVVRRRQTQQNPRPPTAHGVGNTEKSAPVFSLRSVTDAAASALRKPTATDYSHTDGMSTPSCHAIASAMDWWSRVCIMPDTMTYAHGTVPPFMNTGMHPPQVA